MLKNKFTMKKALDGLKELEAAGYAIVVDDNGHDSHKSATVLPDGTVKTIKVSSLVAIGEKGTLTDIQGLAVGAYKIDGETYTCNETLGRDKQTMLDSYQYSNENLALFAGCVERLKIWDKKLIMATTLPVKRMDVDGNVEKVKSQFAKNVVRHSQDGKLTIVNHLILAEGQAAFYDWAINFDGSINKEATEIKTVLIVDIGGGTTDGVTITSAGQLNVSTDKARCFTLEGFGLVALKDEVSIVVKRELNKSLPEHFRSAAENIAPNTINMAFETGHINFPMLSSPIDISDEIVELKKRWVQKLIRQIIEHIDRLDGYDKIVFAGGGAVVLENEINQLFPGSVYLDEYANANGLLKVMICMFLPRYKDKFATQVKEV